MANDERPSMVDADFFVGSPPAFASGIIPEPAGLPSSAPVATHILPRRVSIVPSTSAPGRPQAHRTPTTLQRMTLEVKSRLGGEPEREWTVFEGAMARDREQGKATAASLRRTPTLRSRGSFFANDELNIVPPTRTTSPVFDEHIVNERYDPSDEGEDEEEEEDEEDEDDDSDGTQTTETESLGEDTAPWWRRVPQLTRLQKNILKCSIAYFIASLFTYNSTLSHFVAILQDDGPDGRRYPSPSAHMVATIAVYFNPAKTVGGMVEADIYCLLSLACVSVISLVSMNLYWAFEPHAGWEWLADILAILWVGLGMSGVAWMKTYMAKPTFNTACSMFAIILFVVVVKEGGVPTLLGVALIVLVGSTVANAVCVLVWPQSATAQLEAAMNNTLDGYGTLLRLLTDTFLLVAPRRRLSRERLAAAVAAHQAGFTALKKHLAEATSETMCGSPRGRTHRPYEDAVDALTRLGQHLNGLRSGITLQHELARAHRAGSMRRRRASAKLGSEEDEEERAMMAVFGDLVDELGPPLRALSKTCTRAIRRVREAFITRSSATAAQAEMLPAELLALVQAIERQLFLFESTSNQAVLRLYTRSDPGLIAPPSAASGLTDATRGSPVLGFPGTNGLNSGSSKFSLHGSRASVASGVGVDANPLFAAGGENENVFLVYFFIFTLQEFAAELVNLVDAMARICAAERVRTGPSCTVPWWRRYPAHILARFSWRRAGRPDAGRSAESGYGSVGNGRPGTGNGGQKGAARHGLRRSLSEYLRGTDAPATRIGLGAHFPKVRPHAPNTMSTPAHSELSLLGRAKQLAWRIGARAQESDVKYAIKAGMATAALAAPAFFERTRPTFMEYRGEWALISFFVVLSPTIGATNYLSVHRVLGTLFGAAVAASVYTLFGEHPVVLSLFGFVFSLPCFYYIVATPQYATTGRFVLLTYNLTCLYSYNIRRRDISVFDIAYHRFIAVTVGVLWAAFVSRFWWPAEARRELSKQLGEFCLNMGWLYTRLAASNSLATTDERPLTSDDESAEPTEESALVPRRPRTTLSNSVEEFMAMELHLQLQLIKLQELLKQTAHEPRLKGPFPVPLYRAILASLQTILDRLHSMRCVTAREEWHTTVRRDFILPVNRERREMAGNVVLYFSVLAAAFRLKAPLPPYLPPAENARGALVDAIRRLDVVRNRETKGSRQLLFFAYALTMRGITHELDFLGRTCQEAFGVIGPGTRAFEEMFADEDTRRAGMA